MIDPNEREPIDIVPYDGYRYTPWWGEGSEPRMLPPDQTPERGQDRSTPARVINIAPDISDERRAEIEAAVRNGLGISPNDGLGIGLG